MLRRAFLFYPGRMEPSMLGESYRLNRKTLAINSGGENRASIFIPANAIVTIIAGPLNGNRLVDVKWEDLTLMIFAEDLRDRGTLITRK
jgi:hypothetical protein